jgi:hypothetical protein
MSEEDNEGEAFCARRSPGDNCNCSDGILIIKPDRMATREYCIFNIQDLIRSMGAFA